VAARQRHSDKILKDGYCLAYRRAKVRTVTFRELRNRSCERSVTSARHRRQVPGSLRVNGHATGTNQDHRYPLPGRLACRKTGELNVAVGPLTRVVEAGPTRAVQDDVRGARFNDPRSHEAHVEPCDHADGGCGRPRQVGNLVELVRTSTPSPRGGYVMLEV
jgi:hypothetical protein